MLSHNNWEEQIKKYASSKQRFTIKKLSVGVASVLLGVTFAAGTASADSTTSNADSASGSDSEEQTDHNLTLNSTSTSTLKSATATSQNDSASVAIQNPAGDVKAQAANNYEAAVSAAVQNNSASSVQNSSATDSGAQSSAAKSTDTSAFSVRSAVANNFNYANVFASLAAMPQANNGNTVNDSLGQSADNSEYNNYQTVTNWYDLQSAIYSGAQGVNIKGNITPGWFGGNDLNIYGNFTIHGVDGAVLNLGQNKIVNNGQLTLDNVTVNGAVAGNGIVNIKGIVNSNINASNGLIKGNTAEVAALLDDVIGTTNGGGYGLTWSGNASSWEATNWYKANIKALKINIDQDATLNINRSVAGDGIEAPNYGAVSIGINSKLNINLKDAQNATRANEQSRSIDNASAGIRIYDNGTITSDDSAQIIINAGHGRAIVVNEPFGGTSAVANNTSLEEWENGRTGDKSAEAAKHRNTMILGDSTKMNLTGRGGIVLGYTATFVTGNHSIIHIDNQGNGEGLLLDANSKVIVSPHSQLLMTSDGKNASGYYGGGNYIGMGQDAKFRVEHDAVFRYKLTNSMNNERRPYADNFNIISQASNTHPEVYVGNNATFDGQSDYDDYYGEIFAFSLTSGANTSTVFQIDGAKYVNWEKNSQVLGHNGAGNLFYSMSAGLIDATGQKYYVFKWNNKNLNDNNYTFNDSSANSIAQSIQNFKNSSDKYWTDIEHLATKYSRSGNTAEWPGHVVSGNDITSGSGYNPVDQKTGTPIGNYNDGDGDLNHTTGFDPLNSQRLVLVASIIPTQEDKTSQEVDNYNVKIVYDENLKPGQVQLVQKGVNGLKRTTTTTYYNLDPSTGEKTLDTSKGNNGVSTTTTILNQKQDEIIHIGKQNATIGYYHQDGNDTTPVNGIGTNGVVTVSGNPIATDAQGNLKFNADGTAVAADINYNYANDLSTAKNGGYSVVKTDTWNSSSKKYNVSGLTKEAIQQVAEKAGLNNPTMVGQASVNAENPNFKVVTAKPEVKKGSVEVVYHDDTTNTTIPNVGFNSGDEAADTPVTYNPEKNISDLEKQGYVYVRTEGTLPDKVEANKNITVTVHMKHGVQPVTPTTPPTDVPKNTPKEAQPDQLTKKVNLTVNYVNADGTDFTGNVPANAKQTATFTGTAYVDKITGQLVNAKQEDGKWVINTDDTATPEITWTSDKTAFEGVTSPAEKGYHVSNVSSHADGDNVAAITDLTKNSQDITVTVTYAKNGTKVVGERTVKASMTVHYTGAGDLTPKDNVQSGVNFHYTGDVHDAETDELVSEGHWEVNGVAGDSYQFNEVDSPVVSGYTAETKVVPGFKATPDKPTFETTVNYTKNGTDIQNKQDIPASQTVQYVDDQGNTLRPDKSQNFEFNYSGDTVDKVTGETTKQGIWNETSYNFTAENVPVIDGYVAVSGYTNNNGEYTAGGFTATNTGSKENNNRVFKVVYQKVGNIVPQLPDGTPVPNPDKPGENVPNKPYTNDPSNPTDVNPKEPVPNIPGYRPEVPTVTPEVPTKDTPVVYNQIQKADLTIVDQDNGNKQIVVSGVTTKFTTDGINGEAITFTGNEAAVKALENMGYVYVDSDFTSGTKFDGATDQHFTITMKHGTQPVNPSTPGKPGEPINPNDPEGPKYPQGSDQVTKNVTRTIQYVDENGNQLRNSVEQPVNFTAEGVLDKVTGQWKTPLTWSGSQTVNGVKSPVIEGYHLVSVDRDGEGNNVKGVSLTHENDSYTVTVKYAKNGKIIPVDPTGKPIPNVPTPQYPTDPENPAKVTPDEPVPSIPGYTPEVPTVTPTDPGKDTPVKYTPVDNTQNAQVRYIDLTDDKELANSGNLSGQPGDKINYSTADTIKSLTDKGYVLVNDGFPADAAFDNDKGHDQVFTVTFRHGTQPVNPNEPGKPGQPINPNDPEGPKYPQGSDQVTKNVTRTIQYVDENGNKVSDSVEQPVNFTAEGVLDKVTGQWVTPLTWSGSQTVNGVKSPVVEGYHLVSVDRDGEGNNVKGVTLTHENDSYTVTVKYAKNGNIIPVDPTGKPIPNVPTPQYPTDPTDPSKVTPNEPVPSIPGLTPEVPTVTPTDPGKNTPVKYSQTVNATVTYIDDVTGESLKTDSLSGLEGVKSDYSTKSSIDGYEAQGYKVVSDNFPKGGYTFSVEGTHNFTVHLTYTTSPVNPDHPGAGYNKTDLQKDVTRTIYFVNTQDGKQVAEPVNQTVSFTANGTVDNVTGKLVTVADGKITGPGELTWTPAQDVKGVQSPAVNGMHVTFVTRDADGTNVKGVSLTHNDSSYDVYVNYAPNGTTNEHGQNIPASQTIKFVDENGNTLRENNVQTSEFVRTPDVVDAFTGKTITEGSWKETSHKFGVIDVPVIDGYVATVKTAGGLTATTDNPNVVTEVVYKKVGKIIPVDPTGKPIPNVPTPEYPNDPTDPTKVTPNEPVPTIPGYTPETPTVTPEVPTKDTPVVYTPVDNTQNAQVRYIDLTNNEEIANSGNLSGQPGDKINYSTADTIKSLTDKGYVLVNDGFPADAAFDNDKGYDQVFTVTFRHGTQPVNPNEPGKPGQPINPNDPEGPKYPQGSDQVTKNVTRTVQYVDENGNKISDPVEQTVNFTAEGVLDKVTGQWVTPLTWSGSQFVAGVKTPVVEGYHVVNVDRDGDGVNVKGITLTHENDNYTVTVQYAKNGKIVPVDPTGKPIPNVPTPQYPTDPENPAKVTPDEPVPSIPGFVPEVPTVTPTDPGKDTPVHYTPVVNDQNAVVNYVDQDNNNAQIATSGNLTGKPGSLIDYSTAATIKQLEDQGYVLVSNGFPAGAVFDNDDNTTQTYTVVLKHGTTTFKPDKPGTPGEPINPNYPEGPKVTNEDVDYSKDVKFTVHYVGAGSNNPADNVQNAQWTRAITVDNVTGKIISSTEWVSNKDSYSNVATPVVEGYHADRAQVDGQKVTMEDQEATVTYVPNGKIVPVDPTGKPIPNVPTPQYPTDPTDPTKVTPNEPVPTIPNYTPEVPTVTPTDPGVDTPVKYTPNTVNPKPAVDQIAVVNYVDQDNNNAQIATSGNLTGKAGSVINYSTADEIKQLEAQGYVLVTDGFPAGATFDDNADQNQVFTVVLKHGTAPVGPKNPEEPGTPVNLGYPEGPKWPAKDNYTKDYTSTVHFVDNNGNKMRDDNVQTSTWTRTLIIDKVTGQILNPNENWTSNKASYNEVKVPVINGYVADKANVPAKEAVQQNIEDTVTYTKVGNIVPVDPSGNRIPNVPVVPYTNDPTDPTKVVPNEPVPSVPGMTPNVTTVTPDHPTVDTPVVYTTPTPVTPQTPVTPEPETPAEPARPAETPAQPAAPEAPAAPKAATPAKQEAKKLPQTGNENSSSAAALGLAALGLTGLLAAGKKRRKED